MNIGVYWNEKRLTELPNGPAAAKIRATGYRPFDLSKELRQEVPPSYDSFFLFPAWVRAQYIPYTATWVFTGRTGSCFSSTTARASGLGTKSELAIKHALATMDVVPEGLPLSDAAMVAADLAEALAQLPEVTNVEVVGEVRRREEFVCEATLLLSAQLDKTGDILATFSSAPYVRQVLTLGSTYMTVILGIGLKARLIVVTPSEFTTQLCYYTGSAGHWHALVARAKQCGLELTPASLRGQDGPLPLESEQDLYYHLGLDFVIPELRTGKGEVLAARHGTLPQVISPEHMKGDLHLHTNWSDGRESIFSLARAAVERGYEYIAITDHSQRLKIARGLDAQRLAAQADEIAAARAEFPNLTILAGIEADILADGQLDLPNQVLAKLDLVIASVHSGFRQDEKTMTSRIVTALRNPFVHILAHPSGRLIGRRPAYQVNLDTVLEEARLLGKILKINASPERLTLALNGLPKLSIWD